MHQNLLKDLKKFCQERIGELANYCRISIESYQLEENNCKTNSLFITIYGTYSVLNELLPYEQELDSMAEKMGLNAILIIPDAPNNLDYFFKN